MAGRVVAAAGEGGAGGNGRGWRVADSGDEARKGAAVAGGGEAEAGGGGGLDGGTEARTHVVAVATKEQRTDGEPANGGRYGQGWVVAAVG